jgi:hypothetical protein
LIADDRLGQAGVREIGRDRPVHPAGDDDHVQPGGTRGAQRRPRPRPQDAVLRDQRPVEVARERVDLAREALRQDQLVEAAT